MPVTAPPESAALERVPCGLCGGEAFRFLFNARDYISGNQGEWPVAQCLGCGVVLMNPRIPPSRIGSYYPTDYYTVMESPLAVEGGWKRAARDLAAQRLHGYPITVAGSWGERAVGRALLPYTRRWGDTCKIIEPVRGGRVLDVGCGGGFALSEYRHLGWETYGVEVSADSAARARSAGHTVFVGELPDAHHPDEFFDAVTLWDSLEHIHNPLEILREVRRILRPAGKVHIAVPNFGSAYARLFRDVWFMFTAPLHYYHYTAATLSRLLMDAGFARPVISYPLGYAGVTGTLEAATRDVAPLGRLLKSKPARRLLRLVDYAAPRGHLFAMAGKQQRSAASGEA